MSRYLTQDEVMELLRMILAQTGGLSGVRDPGGLDSALAQPRMQFAGEDLYTELVDKVAALGHSLVCNHPFMDGNKRIGHAAMETVLVLNGWELSADVDEQEEMILRLAAGQVKRDDFTAWVRSHLKPYGITK